MKNRIKELKYIKLDSKSLQLMILTDVSFVNNKDLSSQIRMTVGLGFEQKFLLNPWVWVRSGWVFKLDLFNP
jgi:hypothetical protein